MISLGFIVPIYNAMLCIYYLLVVKYNIRDEVIARYEPLMHFISICPTLSAAITAVANDLMNNYLLVCWIQERDHFYLNKTSDHKHSILLSGIHIIAIAFGSLVLLTIGYCMIKLYRFVKDQEVKMNTYQFQRPDSINSSSGNRTTRRSQSSRLSNDVVDTKKQAFLYVGSFILTYLFTIICFAFEIFETELPYALMLMQAILTPLQGFWNFLAYVRPRFNIISRQHSEKSICGRLYITVFHKPEPSSQGSTRRRRRRRQLPAQRREITGRERSNDVEIAGRGASRSNVTQNNLLTHQNYQPKVPTESANDFKKSDQAQDHSELQQHHIVPLSGESPPTNGNGVNDEIVKVLHHGINLKNDAEAGAGDLHMISHTDYDEEEQSEQNVDEQDFATTRPPSDYREAVTLSLLVAEDILPRSLNRNGNERKRRASMIDRLPIGVNSQNKGSSRTRHYLERRNEKESISSNGNVQKRRPSCSVMTDMEEKIFKNLK